MTEQLWCKIHIKKSEKARDQTQYIIPSSFKRNRNIKPTEDKTGETLEEV